MRIRPGEAYSCWGRGYEEGQEMLVLTKTAVEGPKFALLPHLYKGLSDQSVSVKAALHCFALHSAARH